MKHSGLGIASFSMSIIVGLLTMFVFAIAGFLEATTPGGMPKTSPAIMLLGLGILFLGILTLFSLVLGIAALCQKERKRIFGLLGTIFSTIMLLGTVGLMILGSVAA